MMKSDIAKIVRKTDGEKYRSDGLDSIKMTGSTGKDIVGFGPYLILLQCEFTRK
mgnify:CR=1 FL=1